MSRRLKLLGLAAVAVLSLSAVSAAGASAANFHAEKSPTFLSGTQETKNVFTINGGTVKCNNATFTSEEIAGTTLASVEVHPEYSGCTAFGQNATVDTGTSGEGCNYVIYANGEVDVVCDPGEVITVTAVTSGCTVVVEGQTGLSSVSFTNGLDGSIGNVLVTANVMNIGYTSSGGICGESGTNGKYTGSVRTRGYDDASLMTQHTISWS